MIVTPTPLGDISDPQPPRPGVVTAESAEVRLYPPPENPAPRPTRTWFPLEHLRQIIQRRFRKPRPGLGSSSILDTIVESPSVPETTMSLSANRPLPRDDAHQHQHHPSHSHSQSQSQPQSRHHNHPSSSFDDPQRSGTPYIPWPAGFIPYHPGHGATSSSSKSSPSPERDHRLVHARPTPNPAPNGNLTPQNGQARTHTQRASTSTGRGAVGGTYAAAPLPQGVTYPAPPVRPHKSHRQHTDRDWDRDRDSYRDRERVRDRDRERRRDSGRDSERARDRDRLGGRDRDRDREDPEDTVLDEELTRSPSSFSAISLYHSDEEQ
ncbi:hypothetical protein OG21DRAFT_1507708 [Imleria badia]|nr:hypothetical protein OG21DRAFT_1507708 [Imleria badia]